MFYPYINDVPGSVFYPFLLHFFFSIFCKSEYQITCRTPTAVEIRCLNNRVLITMSYINIVLNIIPTLYEGYI